ncbi:M23 family metallopeptidase [Paraburkholderia panacisoli]|uniref:M23 family metallopeptidase n=1 Tax=Paraburkholderia panacisoli TaxID=2603818 RepID=A0A5B0HBD3_9BURK|nr:M23 family metallopeptidase [Paraburkholderia panacisoli]KAA1012616.1 M23 family metallopeptidase [Paraburkholderia panacisoli]
MLNMHCVGKTRTPQMRRVRRLLIAEVIVFAGGLATSAFTEDLLPPALVAFDTDREGIDGATRLAAWLGIFYIVSSFCSSAALYFAVPYARAFYVASTCLGVVLLPLLGPYASAGWSDLLDALGSLISGAIIAMVYTSPTKECFGGGRKPPTPALVLLVLGVAAAAGMQPGVVRLAEGKPLIRGSVGKFLHKSGIEINKGAIAVGGGVEHLGGEIGKFANKKGTEIEKGLCSLFTAGGSDSGSAGCGVSVGAGVDEKGPYTYDPAKPDERYHGNETSGDPKTAELIKGADYLRQVPIETWEYEDNDVYGIRRFVPPDTVIGEAWPDAAKELKPPTQSGAVRQCGHEGCGGFLATRPATSGGGLRFHAGVDFLTKPGDPIYSPMNGWVERPKNPGRPHMTGLLIKNSAGYEASIFYVQPSKAILDSFSKGVAPDGISKRYPVKAGETIIGYAQDLHVDYPAGVPNHVHLSLTDPSGRPVAPDGVTRIKKTPASPAH